jgi:NADH-quinone oxidoreductase subunit J
MSGGLILFGICQLLCIGGALATILSKNPIRGALGLLTTIFGIAGLFLRLNAQFLAAMQILVYAGAVVILFVFVIMLLGTNAGIAESGPNRSRFSRALAGCLVGILGAFALYFIGTASNNSFLPVGPDHGSVEAVGGRVFREGLVPFELATALLIVAVIGAIAVARTAPSKKKKVESADPSARMYHGPVVARDGGAPVVPLTPSMLPQSKESA